MTGVCLQWRLKCIRGLVVWVTIGVLPMVSHSNPNRVGRTSPEREMFSQSQAYEHFMGRWSRLLAPLLVRFADVQGRSSVLDVGSGTGALASAIAAAVPSCQVTGVDPAADYVAYAQAHVPNGRVRFAVGDAQQLRFADGTFDQTLSLLVLNFIPDPKKALREMIRVTRSGGVVAAAVWDYGQGMEMLRIFWDEAVALDPGIDRRDERHMPYCRKGELEALWRENDLQNVQERPLTIQLDFSSFEDYWIPFLAGQGPAGNYAASLGQDQLAQLQLRLRRRLVGKGQDRPFKLQARAWAVRGIVRPH